MSSTVMPGGVLCAAFQTFQTKEEKQAEEKREKEREARVEQLVERIFKSSPIGKKIVESAIERGIAIGIDGDKGNSLGCYIPSMKYVSLSETATDAQLLSTIVHECRHSEQNPVHDHCNTVFACVTEVRALEADAMAHECAAIYQMRKAEPETYETFTKRHGGIMKAYEDSFEKDKDGTKARAEAFKAWYDNAGYIRQYDENQIDFMAMGTLYGGAYKKDIPAKQLSESVGYIEPEFFTSARATTVSEENAKRAAKVERGHARHALKLFWKPKETSADQFYVRMQDGTVMPPKRPAGQAALMQAAAKRARE